MKESPLGTNYWSHHGGPRMWTDFDPEAVSQELRWARDMGLTSLRGFVYWPDFEPDAGGDNQLCWTHVNQFLTMASAQGLQTFPT